MLSKDEAQHWPVDMYTNGTYNDRNLYKERFGVGRMAESCWDDPLFTYGIEYGILIAVSKIFGDLEND